jgi:acetylornithine deacetylase
LITEEERRVLEFIDGGREDIIEYLRKLIGFKTVTTQENEKAEGEDYRGFQKFLRSTLEEMGFEMDEWEIDSSELDSFPGSGVLKDRDLSNMPVLAGKLEGDGNGRSLILNGHYDVVPAGIIENWTHPPFGAVMEDDKIFGRGANDMKGGIAAIIHALKAIQEAGIILKGDVTVESVPDEEQTSMGTLSCCQRGYTADAAIIPEPTNMKVLVAVRGSVYGKITVIGRAGHAEMPQPDWTEGGAVNAISKAAKIIVALDELNEEWKMSPEKQHKYLDPDMITPTIIHGGEWPVTVPEKVEITFGSMFIPSTKDKIKEIEAKLKNVADSDPWLKEHPPKLEAEGWQYGAEVKENEPIVETGKQALRDLGIEPELRGFGSLTDAIHLINHMGIPTISIGPDIDTAHMANEYVDIDELMNTTKAIALCIMRWCGTGT